MFDDRAYASGSYTVPPGSRILLYSDGAYELALGNGRQLSLAEFMELFSQLAASADSSVDNLVESLRNLTPPAPSTTTAHSSYSTSTDQRARRTPNPRTHADLWSTVCAVDCSRGPSD